MPFWKTWIPRGNNDDSYEAADVQQIYPLWYPRKDFIIIIIIIIIIITIIIITIGCSRKYLVQSVVKVP